MIQISIGILIYNNEEAEIIRCLDSIKHQTALVNINSVLIRNQGVECFKGLIDRWNEENNSALKIIYSQGENVGFGKGHNILFEESPATSAAYLCMNPDGFMHPNCIESLLRMAKKTSYSGIYESLQEPIMHPKYFQPKTGATDWCSAACLMIPVSIYNAVKGFDEDFFLYCEDVDISWRVKAAGFYCYTCNDARYFHYSVERSTRELDLWKSAAILAHKWRAVKFKELALRQLKEIYYLDPTLIEEGLNEINQHSVGMIYKANPNFRNNFHFARPMWQ